MLTKAFGLVLAGVLQFLSTGASRASETADANQAQTPPDKSPARHPFLYAGEWDTRKPLEQSIFIVREGKIVWQYSMPLNTASGGNQEFDDATLLSNGNIIFSRMSGAGMVSPDKKLVWDYPAPRRNRNPLVPIHRQRPRPDHAQRQSGPGDDHQHRHRQDSKKKSPSRPPSPAPTASSATFA